MTICYFRSLLIVSLILVGESLASGDVDIGVTIDYADIVLVNAKIYTVDTKNPWAEAVALRGNTIVYVGTNEGAQLYVGPKTTKFSLKNKLVLPGLVDSHTHPVPTSMIEELLDMPINLDADQIVDAVNEYAKEHPNLKVIRGGLWRVSAFGPGGPNKDLLDEAVRDRPVILEDDSGHSQWLNSTAMEVMGIDKNTVDPIPGVIYFVRDSDGDPTGWAKESAAGPYMEKLGLPSAFNEADLKAFLDYLLSMGVTTVFDAGSGGTSFDSNNVYSVLAKMDSEKTLPVRYFASYTIHNPDQLPTAISKLKNLRKKFEGERLKFTTIKLFLDGVNEVGTSFVLDPFAHDPSSRGRSTVTSDQLENLLTDLHNEHIDLHIHSVGDAAVRMALDAVENVQVCVGKLNSRVTLSHIELISDSDMDRFAKLGVVGNHTPHWDGGYFKGADKILGIERYNLMYRVQPLLDTGAVVSLSSDITTVKEWKHEGRGSPYHGIQTAHNRQDVPDGKDATIRSTERLEIEYLIKGYTLNGAYQLGQENISGSIEVGKIADFVVLNENIFSMNRYKIHMIVPRAVIMDGQVVHGSLSDLP